MRRSKRSFGRKEPGGRWKAHASVLGLRAIYEAIDEEFFSFFGICQRRDYTGHCFIGSGRSRKTLKPAWLAVGRGGDSAWTTSPGLGLLDGCIIALEKRFHHRMSPGQTRPTPFFFWWLGNVSDSINAFLLPAGPRKEKRFNLDPIRRIRGFVGPKDMWKSHFIIECSRGKLAHPIFLLEGKTGDLVGKRKRLHHHFPLTGWPSEGEEIQPGPDSSDSRICWTERFISSSVSGANSPQPFFFGRGVGRDGGLAESASICACAPRDL